jgi:hypothetical protein
MQMERSEIRVPKPRNGKTEIEEPVSKRTTLINRGRGNIADCMDFTETGTTNVPSSARRAMEAALSSIRRYVAKVHEPFSKLRAYQSVS